MNPNNVSEATPSASTQLVGEINRLHIPSMDARLHIVAVLDAESTAKGVA